MSEGKRFLGKVNWHLLLLAMAGFACYRLYISVFFVMNNVVPQPSSSMGLAYDAYSVLLTLLVLASAFIKKPGFFSSGRMAAVGSLLMAGGAVLYSTGTVAGAWVFAVAASAGVALLTVQWGLALGGLGRAEGVISVVAGFFLAALLNTGVGSLWVVYVAASALAGPVSCLFLVSLQKLCGDALKPDGKGGAASVKYVGKASSAFFLFAVASIFCSIPMEISVSSFSDASRALPLLRTCVTAFVCLIAAACVLVPGFSIKALYRLIPLFLIIGGLSVFLQEMLPLVSYVFALVGRLGFQLVFWIFAPWIANCSKHASSSAFALEFSAYWLGYSASLMLVRMVWPDRSAASVDAMGGMVAAAIVVLMVAYLFVFSEYDLRCATHDESKAQETREGGSAPDFSDAGGLSELAARYGLSPRETEVFLLLARGRDSNYIQNALFISAGTVSSHRQRIYKKLGCHTKQELLDLVEEKLRVS